MARYKTTNENKRELAELLSEPPRIAYWEVAAQMGIHENTLSKHMRMPTDEQTAAIKAAIACIRHEQSESI